MALNNTLYKKLATYGLSGALALSGAFLIAPSEGLRNKPYLDAVGLPTVCYGHMDRGLDTKKVFTDEQCVKLLADDVKKHDNELSRVVQVPYKSDYMHAALVSFTFNVGIGNVRSSTLIKRLNNKQYGLACDQLTRWVYAGNKKLNGLVIRRTNEWQWCMGNPPQEVKDFYEQAKK
jgi:lysozyme